MVCPRCFSNDVSISPKDNSNYFLYFARSWLAVFSVLLFRGFLDKQYGELCVCARCGKKWRAKRTALYLKYRDILSQYLTMTYPALEIRALGETSLRLDEDSLTFFYAKRKTRTIFFENLTVVNYQKSLGPLYGWLSIRDWPHRKLPLPKTFQKARKDRYTIFYDFGEERAYYQIHLALKAIVEENRKAGLF